ncbi:MAG: hypothetical protein F6K56_08745 [Moorea sp. SIO3G5]|nr:hypothetical protein [Moorena sp. SIO3G5]
MNLSKIFLYSINSCLLPLASCLLPLASCLSLREYVHNSNKNAITECLLIFATPIASGLPSW